MSSVRNATSEDTAAVLAYAAESEHPLASLLTSDILALALVTPSVGYLVAEASEQIVGVFLWQSPFGAGDADDQEAMMRLAAAGLAQEQFNMPVITTVQALWFAGAGSVPTAIGFAPITDPEEVRTPQIYEVPYSPELVSQLLAWVEGQ